MAGKQATGKRLQSLYQAITTALKRSGTRTQTRHSFKAPQRSAAKRLKSPGVGSTDLHMVNAMPCSGQLSHAALRFIHHSARQEAGMAHGASAGALDAHTPFTQEAMAAESAKVGSSLGLRSVASKGGSQTPLHSTANRNGSASRWVLFTGSSSPPCVHHTSAAHGLVVWC